MKPPSPFTVLEMAATLDAGAVKRAYFRQLSLHPPQKDPEGFRRLRAAYEVLQQPGGLAAAFMEAPLDLAAAAAPYRERFDARLAEARSQASPLSAGRQLFELLSPLPYQEAVQRFTSIPKAESSAQR